MQVCLKSHQLRHLSHLLLHLDMLRPQLAAPAQAVVEDAVVLEDCQAETTTAQDGEQAQETIMKSRRSELESFLRTERKCIASRRTRYAKTGA